MQDQHKRRGNDVARIAAHRVEDRLQQNVGRTRARQFRLDEAAVRACAARNELRCQCSDGRGQATCGRPEYEQVGGVRIDRNVSGDALERVALSACRDFDGGKSLSTIDCGMRLGKRAGANRNAQCSARIERLDDPAAEIAEIIIDDGDGKLAQDLVQIRLRIIDSVNQGSQEQHAEGAPRSEHAPPLRHEGAAEASRRVADLWLLGRSRRLKPALALEARHAQQCEAGKENRQARKRRERNGGLRNRQSSRRLSKQDGHVPAQRQDRTPGLREGIHADRWKADACVTECRGGEEARKSEPGRQVADQELQQGAHRQIGNNQQGAGGDHQRQVSPEGDLQHALQKQRLGQHDQEEDTEQRRELAGQGCDRIATGTFEPGPRVATAEFGADGIAGGERDHHMDDRRQQRTQQELGIVLLRIDKRDGFRGECSHGSRRRGGAFGGSGHGRRGGKRIVQSRRCDAGRRQELLVIEAYDLRAALSLQVALEIWRDMDCRDRLARPNVPHGRRQRTGAVDDFQARRGRDVFHQGTRSVRLVLVDDRHPEPPYDRMAEYGGENHERKQRHAENQEQRHTIVKQPVALAPCDQPKSGF